MKKLLISLLAITVCYVASAQSVGIGTSSPNSNAQLDISSNNKGLLIPRLTETEKSAIVSPTQGLMIFNTSSNSFQYYGGSSWLNVTNSGIVNGSPNKVARFLGIWGLIPGLMTDDANGVSINTTSAVANSTSMLDIASTTKGILIPRMTTAQRNAIVSPANGLLVCDTTLKSFWFYNGNSWSNINGNGVGDWNVNGNDIYNNNIGNVGIGTSVPAARLAVDSSIMVDQANSNQGFLDRSSLYFGSDKKVGIVRSFLTGSSGRNGLGFFTNNTRRITIDSTGQVGIGTINPLQTLHVNGNSYFVGNVGIGSALPSYAFDNKYGYNYMYYGLAIGPDVTPGATYLMDVGAGGSGVRFRGDFRVDGIVNPTTTFQMGENASVAGSLTVNNTITVNSGKGVAYNANSSTNLRIYQFTTATFNAALAGFGLSPEGAIAFNGGFTGTPRVFVGDIDVTGGASGELYRVQLQLYGCSTTAGTTTCKARLLNTSPNPVNYSITWNCVAIGN